MRLLRRTNESKDVMEVSKDRKRVANKRQIGSKAQCILGVFARLADVQHHQDYDRDGDPEQHSHIYASNRVKD